MSAPSQSEATDDALQMSVGMNESPAALEDVAACFDGTESVEALVSNPAELEQCKAACKAGGATILRYCGTMPTPQLRIMCVSASMVGTVSCIGFCYARFVD